jgi:hypothetical protein
LVSGESIPIYGALTILFLLIRLEKSVLFVILRYYRKLPLNMLSGGVAPPDVGLRGQIGVDRGAGVRRDAGAG